MLAWIHLIGVGKLLGVGIGVNSSRLLQIIYAARCEVFVSVRILSYKAAHAITDQVWIEFFGIKKDQHARNGFHALSTRRSTTLH
jgi:hypothetical protein